MSTQQRRGEAKIVLVVEAFGLPYNGLI